MCNSPAGVRDLLLTHERHLHELVPALAVPADVAHLVPALLVEFDREADVHTALLGLEAPLDAAIHSSVPHRALVREDHGLASGSASLSRRRKPPRVPRGS